MTGPFGNVLHIATACLIINKAIWGKYIKLQVWFDLVILEKLLFTLQSAEEKDAELDSGWAARKATDCWKWIANWADGDSAYRDLGVKLK